MEGSRATQSLINRLKYKHLSLLVALAETGNVHQAAAAIKVAQPSASRMLAGIEEALGFMLFKRHARGLLPTPLGEITLAYARRALAELDRFATDMDVRRRGGYGQLTVGAIMGAAPDLLAMAVADLKAQRPLLNVRILGETSDQIVELLQRGQVDFALGRFTNPLQHNEFDFEPVANESMRFVVRSGHPVCARDKLGLADLAALPWVLQPLTSPARRLFEEELAHLRLASPSNIVECGSIFATLQLVQNSDAIAMLPEPVVRDHVRAGLLRALPVEIGRQLEGFGILRRKGEELDEAAERFIELLRHHAGRASAA